MPSGLAPSLYPQPHTRAPTSLNVPSMKTPIMQSLVSPGYCAAGTEAFHIDHLGIAE